MIGWDAPLAAGCAKERDTRLVSPSWRVAWTWLQPTGLDKTGSAHACRNVLYRRSPAGLCRPSQQLQAWPLLRMALHLPNHLSLPPNHVAALLAVPLAQVSLPEGCTLSELLAVLGAKKQRGEPAAGAVGLLLPLAPAAVAAGARGAGSAITIPAGSVASTYWSPLAGSSLAVSSMASRRASAEGGEHGQGPPAGSAASAAAGPPSAAPHSTQPSTVQTSLLGGEAAAMAAAAGSTISGLQKVRRGIEGFVWWLESWLECSNLHIC